MNYLIDRRNLFKNYFSGLMTIIIDEYKSIHYINRKYIFLNQLGFRKSTGIIYTIVHFK